MLTYILDKETAPAIYHLGVKVFGTIEVSENYKNTAIEMNIVVIVKS